MPEVRLEIGGRQFIVACEPGEEAELLKAGAMLDAEAQVLQEAIGRVPEPRMLLMAGLMLADRTTGLENQLQSAERRVHTLEEQIRQVETKAAKMAASALQMSDENPDAESARSEADAALSALERATRQVEDLAAQLSA